MTADIRSVNILIAALGGEGGGVLADWIVAAANHAGYPAQSTSIPGVAQRTGATTYYLELFPKTVADLDGAIPVLALTPTPGDVDLVVASELVEAGRALQNGFVSPDRTTLVASTNRVFAIGERTAMADGRFDGERILEAANRLARDAILFDMSEAARQAGTPINAVLFGALIASDALPLDRSAAELAIRESGKSVESNLRGFAAGFDLAKAAHRQIAAASTIAKAGGDARALLAQLGSDFPAALHETLAHGVARLRDYQGDSYAKLYLDRLKPVLRLDMAGGSGLALTGETARFLALWMSYEDVIRVADLKTRADRAARIRKEARARDGDILRVTEFLKPGLHELCSLLPPGPGQKLFDYGRSKGWDKSLNTGLYVSSTSVSGFLLMRLLASLRRWRPRTWRYRQEQAMISQWLGAIERAALRDRALALEVALCGQIVKGYGDTHARAIHNFNRIQTVYFEGDAAAAADPAALASAIRDAREKALSNPDGSALEDSIGKFLVPRVSQKIAPPEKVLH